MGYQLINQISTDPRLSRINLFAIVSSKSDLKKVTNLQNNRISDYISFTATFDDVYQKLRHRVSPEGQPQKEFKSLKINAQADASISHISESGCLILSDILFNKNSNIEVYSSLINQVTEKNNNLFKVSKNIPSRSGRFLTEVDFLNLSNKSREAIRKMIFGWTLK